jgi:hypothetical protein
MGAITFKGERVRLHLEAIPGARFGGARTHLVTDKRDDIEEEVQSVTGFSNKRSENVQQNFNRNRFLLVLHIKTTQITPGIAVNRSRGSRKRKKITVLAPFTYVGHDTL